MPLQACWLRPATPRQKQEDRMHPIGVRRAGGNPPPQRPDRRNANTPVSSTRQPRAACRTRTRPRAWPRQMRASTPSRAPERSGRDPLVPSGTPEPGESSHPCAASALQRLARAQHPQPPRGGPREARTWLDALMRPNAAPPHPTSEVIRTSGETRPHE